MQIEWSHNGKSIGFDVMFIILWVGGWGLAEVAIDWVARDRLGLRIGIYSAMFLVSLLIMLFIGNQATKTCS